MREIGMFANQNSACRSSQRPGDGRAKAGETGLAELSVRIGSLLGETNVVLDQRKVLRGPPLSVRNGRTHSHP